MESTQGRPTKRDTMNNEITSTSSDDSPNNDRVSQFNKFYNNKYKDAAISDTETYKSKPRLQTRNHHKSMGNINDSTNETLRSTVQNSISNIDLSLHNDELRKYESLQIPIVGYEVMEEQARFTIYKLKVKDDKTDQCWLVFRRYTDFVRLYSRIKLEQPNVVLPLPGKRWFRDNFETAFLEERVRGLQIFVNAIIKKLPNHPVVREFFCLDEPPQILSYQPEVQAVYGALEDSISNLKIQLKQKDATIMHLQSRISQFESSVRGCRNCSSQYNGSS